MLLQGVIYVEPLGGFGLGGLPLLVAGCVGHESEEGQGGTTSSQQGCEEPSPTVVLDNVSQRDACKEEDMAERACDSDTAGRDQQLRQHGSSI